MVNSSFLKSLKITIFGMSIAQSIPLLGSLIIARLYSPAEFGIYSTWLGLVMTCAVVASGRFEMSLGTEIDKDSRNFSLIATLLTIIFFSSILWIIAIAFFLLIPFFKTMGFFLCIIFFPATFLLAAMHTWQALAAAEGLYRELSLIRIAQSLGIILVQVIVGYYFPSPDSLALGFLLGTLSSVVIGFYLLPLDLRFLKNYRVFIIMLKEFLIKNKHFPLYSLPADLMNSLSNQIPVILIAFKFSEEFSGFFALTIRVLGAPIGLLGAAVLDVFRRNASLSFIKYGHCRNEYLYALKLLSFCGLAMAILVMSTAEHLFVLSFGDAWLESGNLAFLLMPIFALRFIASPLSYVFYIAQKQRIDLIWQSLLLLVTVGSFLLWDSFEVSVRSYVVGYSILYCIYILLSYKFSQGNPNDYRC